MAMRHKIESAEEAMKTLDSRIRGNDRLVEGQSGEELKNRRAAMPSRRSQNCPRAGRRVGTDLNEDAENIRRME